MKKILILTALILALPTRADLYKAKFGLSQLTINGNSSVHKWKVETKVIGGFLNVDSTTLSKIGTTKAAGTVIVPTPVTSRDRSCARAGGSVARRTTRRTRRTRRGVASETRRRTIFFKA